MKMVVVLNFNRCRMWDLLLPKLTSGGIEVSELNRSETFVTCQD